MTLSVPGQVPYHHSFSFEFRDNYEAPDETGTVVPWNSLLYSPEPPASSDEWDYALLDNRTGCPRAVGEQAVFFRDSERESTSRFTQYLLGRQERFGEFVDHLYGQGQGAPLLLLTGALLRLHEADPVPSLKGILPNATVEAEHDALTLRFVESRPDAGHVEWVVRFEFDQDPAHEPYPARISWSEHAQGSSVAPGGALTGELRLEALQPSSRKIALDCSTPGPWQSPRAPPHLLAEDEVPPDTPVPEVYPMQEAYNDALLIPQVQLFLTQHPDARLMAMYAVTVGDRDPVTNTLTDHYRWELAFASPSEGIRLPVSVRRDVREGTTTPGPTEVKDVEPNLPGFAQTAVWKTTPLITLDQALSLAAQAGLSHPTRTGWLEPPAQPFPAWHVEDYFPRAGEPEYQRTAFWMDATTGWAFYSGVDLEAS